MSSTSPPRDIITTKPADIPSASASDKAITNASRYVQDRTCSGAKARNAVSVCDRAVLELDLEDGEGDFVNVSRGSARGRRVHPHARFYPVTKEPGEYSQVSFIKLLLFFFYENTRQSV